RHPKKVERTRWRRAYSFAIDGHPLRRSLAMAIRVFSARPARWWLIPCMAAWCSLGHAAATFAQSVASGTIEGSVRDQSSAVLPGVTITLTSPQLQVGQVVQVSDSAGAYKFVDLPAGTYRLKAELQGFATHIHDELRLTVGFNARVDLTLKLGAM